VESRKFPKLHELGSDGDYYTQEQLRDIIEYARQRGIRVVPEVRHARSRHELGGRVSGAGQWPRALLHRAHVRCVRPAFDRPASPRTSSSTRSSRDGQDFPDAYWHIGGDENNGKQWGANPEIQAFMKKRGMKDAHALQTYFNQRLLGILKKHNKRMMGWDEIFQPGLPKETVVHSWRGQKSLFDAAKQGYDGVLSAGYYIDLLETAARHYAVDPLPANSGLTEAEATHILGGEATMWGEWVGPDTIESRIWPRGAAIAERFWSPRE
jgi:hexosaminidase